MRRARSLEGDGLEGLCVTDTIEEIRLKGRTLKEQPSNMPNLAAVLRSEVNIVVGTKVHEYFGAPYNAWFDGKVTKIVGVPPVYTVKYSDGAEMGSPTFSSARASTSSCPTWASSWRG